MSTAHLATGPDRGVMERGQAEVREGRCGGWDSHRGRSGHTECNGALVLGQGALLLTRGSVETPPEGLGRVEKGDRALWRAVHRAGLLSPSYLDVVQRGVSVRLVRGWSRLWKSRGWRQGRAVGQTNDLEVVLDGWHTRGIARPWASRRPPAAVTPLFGLVKPSGKIRVIQDLRPVNRITVPFPKFHLPKVATARSWWSAGMSAGMSDLRDAFYAIGLTKQARKWMAFRWRDRIWEMLRLSMGWRNSPAAFGRPAASRVIFS